MFKELKAYAREVGVAARDANFCTDVNALLALINDANGMDKRAVKTLLNARVTQRQQELAQQRREQREAEREAERHKQEEQQRQEQMRQVQEEKKKQTQENTKAMWKAAKQKILEDSRD